MFRAAVIYAPADPTMIALAERVAASLDRQRFSVALKPAAQAAIPDLAGSDLVLLGCAPQGRAAIDADFTELIRALSGVNLAGRVAGLFTPAGEGALRALKKALKDTDIHLAPENLLPAGESEGKRIADWIARLVAQLETIARGR
jgi:flavodoxin